MNEIFISVAIKEKVLGQIFSKYIDNVFEGKLSCSLLEINPGDEWKRKIKENLDKCNVLVSFLTPFYTERPWAYVEWAAFWFSENKHTLLIFPEFKDNQMIQLFSPFHDVQAAFIDNDETIRCLLKKIQDITNISGKNINSEGNKLAAELITAYKNILLEKKSNEYSIYKEDIEKLPFYDSEIKEIALHFYKTHDSDTFFRISQRIISEEIKYEIAKYILYNKDYNYFSTFVSNIDSGDKLIALLKTIVYQHHQQDSEITFQLIEKIKCTSEDYLVIFIKDLVKNGLIKSNLYNYLFSCLGLDNSKRRVFFFLYELGYEGIILDNIISSIESNVEKVRIALYFAENKKINEFNSLIQLISNSSELFRLFRKLWMSNITDEYLIQTLNNIKNKTTMQDILSYSLKNNLSAKIINHIENLKNKVEY